MSETTQTDDKTKKVERDVSTIGFPYVHFDDALTVAKAIFDAGGVPCTRDQLSSLMSGAGNFSAKLTAARTFGLIEGVAGKYQLTPLAYNALDKDETRQKEARAEAFLIVPLFKRVYDEFRGKLLPPRPLGLEQALVSFGVAPKQRSYARIALDKSAIQTGYFQNGNNDRLVAPIIAVGSKPQNDGTKQEEVVADARATTQSPRLNAEAKTLAPADTSTKKLHPFIEGLLDELPPPRTPWSHIDRVKWLLAAAQIFDLIYKPDDQNMPKSPIRISVE